MNIALEIVRIAQSEIGTSEIGGSNCGPRVNEYKSATKLNPKAPWPWCAAFACWVILKAMEGKQCPWRRPTTAGAWDFENWAIKQPGVSLLRNPKPKDIKAGDILVYIFSHIGFAAKDGAPVCTAIEGNTDGGGGRDGGSVMAKARKIDIIRSRIRLGEPVADTPSDFIALAAWCKEYGFAMYSVHVPSRYYDAKTETTYASAAELRAFRNLTST
jgi:hypothetical protein